MRRSCRPARDHTGHGRRRESDVSAPLEAAYRPRRRERRAPPAAPATGLRTAPGGEHTRRGLPLPWRSRGRSVILCGGG